MATKKYNTDIYSFFFKIYDIINNFLVFSKDDSRFAFVKQNSDGKNYNVISMNDVGVLESGQTDYILGVTCKAKWNRTRYTITIHY